VKARREFLGAGLVAALASCARRLEKLPVISVVPPFTLVAQDGAPFSSDRLRGTPWLASFFFASCNGPCPRMNREIYDLQERTYPYKGLKIVSFTVDPERDTPEVLAAYAKRYKADPERWFFLTGERAKISEIAKNGFLVGELGLETSHTTRIMLVDGRSRVRGHFASGEKDGIGALEAGIRSVYEEGS
jgi:protein SCO1/2